LIQNWFVSICVKAKGKGTSQNDEHRPMNTNPIDKKPATAGPKTELICQTELLQVAAFGYIF
jgi:hypothetical protein